MEAVIIAGVLDIEKYCKIEALLYGYHSLKAKFDDTVEQMLMSADDSAENYAQFEKQFLDDSDNIKYVECSFKAKIKTLHRKLAGEQARQSLVPPAVNLNSSFRVQNQPSQPKLEKIQIPVFDGDILKFHSFKGLYENLVHNNTELSSVQKFYYLKQALVGTAGDMIKDFELNETSHIEAWSFVLSRFDNKRAVVRTLFRKFSNLEAISSSFKVRSLLDQSHIIIRGLKAAGEKIDDTFSRYITYHVSSRLDKETARDWENSMTSLTTYPLYNELQKFLQIRSFASEEKTTDAKFKPNSQSKRVCNTASSDQSTNCKCCKKGSHSLTLCPEFLAKTPYQRFRYVKNLGICLNCFASKHSSLQCQCGGCKICQGKHNSLLHFESNSVTPVSDSKVETVDPILSPTSSSTAPRVWAVATTSSKFVLLATAVVRYRSGQSVGHLRILLDTGSQINAIFDEFVRRKGLKQFVSTSAITGIGGDVTSNYAVSLTILSRYSDFSLQFNADVIPASYVSYQTPSVVINDLKKTLPSLELADEGLSYNSIDVILSAEYAEKCLLGRKIEINKISLRCSEFGLIVVGSVTPTSQSSQLASSTIFCHTMKSINQQLQKFWEIEEAEIVKPKTTLKTECEAHFLSTYSRIQDGRFVVRLPVKGDLSAFDERSKVRAVRSSLRSERSTHQPVRALYSSFMTEYQTLSHMSLVPPSEEECAPCYYIPHYVILKPESTTTKLRVIFNASAKSESGLSLNDVLMVGDNLQRELFDILVDFRRHQVAFCADITKMYRQILVNQRDRDLQRIVWRDGPQESVQTYRLNTVTYGTASASFLATKCLDLLAEFIEVETPIVAHTIRSCFYMDDLLTGAESVSEALDLQSSVHSVLLTGQFPLRKYVSNSAELMSSLPKELLGELTNQDFEHSATSILGLIWNPETDEFQVKIHGNLLQIYDGVSTKRIILSMISRIFDPLGMLAPLVIRGKLLLQELWREKIDWDDPLPQSIDTSFKFLLREFLLMKDFSVRRVYSKSSCNFRELIGFCDASLSAYAAVIYVRSINLCNSNSTDCYFVCAKSRVAPLNANNIHRLELLGAVLLSNLLTRVGATLNINRSDIFAYSDSRVVLSWIVKPPDDIFVSNRVRKIRASVDPIQWAYVATSDNLADLPSRDVTAKTLINSAVWLNGPNFINENFSFTP